MAITFISPKKRQKMLTSGIIVLFFLILIIIAIKVFLGKPKSILPEQVFKPTKIDINFRILESDQLKGLESFTKINKEFNYQGKTKNGEDQTGKISAPSKEEAIQLLEKLELSDLVVEEIKIGRANPFVFYETILPKSKTKK